MYWFIVASSHKYSSTGVLTKLRVYWFIMAFSHTSIQVLEYSQSCACTGSSWRFHTHVFKYWSTHKAARVLVHHGVFTHKYSSTGVLTKLRVYWFIMAFSHTSIQVLEYSQSCACTGSSWRPQTQVFKYWSTHKAARVLVHHGVLTHTYLSTGVLTKLRVYWFIMAFSHTSIQVLEYSQSCACTGSSWRPHTQVFKYWSTHKAARVLVHHGVLTHKYSSTAVLTKLRVYWFIMASSHTTASASAFATYSGGWKSGNP